MMTPRRDGNTRDLRVVIEINNADLRIGAVNDALDLAELATPAGVRFVICGPLTAAFRQEAARRGIDTRKASSRMISKRSLALYVCDVLRWVVRLIAWRTDVVHLNYPGHGPSLACAAWICRVPVVGRARPFDPHNVANRWIGAYVANCRAHAAELLESPLAERVVVAGDLFRPGRVSATLVAQTPLPPRRTGVPRAVFLGQLVERKGLHTLIEAFARVTEPAELLIVGGDWNAEGYPRRLRDMARDLGVVHRIHFENHRPDVGAILSTADLFVLPSLSEARPRSIIEAMSLGVPVVASDVGGIPSLVEHEATGLLVRPGDVDSLAAALQRLMHTPSLLARLGGAGREFVARECQPDRTALAYVRLYRELANGQHAATANPAHVARARS